jgi:hypothetical protein
VSRPDGVDVAGMASRATVARLMREIEDEVRSQRQARALARGGPDDYRDETIFAAVESVLSRAVDRNNPDALLLPQLLDDDRWDLQLPLKFESHRPLIGPALIFIKKRLLLPLTHWLYEYSLENFRRQQRINRLLFAAVEELALENARLRGILGLGGRQDFAIAAEDEDEEGEEGQVGQEGPEGRARRAGRAGKAGKDDDSAEGGDGSGEDDSGGDS